MSTTHRRLTAIPSRQRSLAHRVRRWVRYVLPLTLACSGGGSVEPPERTPVISVLGVQDGESRAGAVTLTIQVDVGTYEALLNGVTFFSGRTVREAGDYVLDVTARNGTAVATRRVEFAIVLGGESQLVIRLINLGDNEAGGGGDAVLLSDSTDAGQRHALIDAGPAGMGGTDTGFVARRLATLGVDTLQALILSHAHSDHFDGIPAILENTTVLRFIYNGQMRTFSRYNDVIADAQQRANEFIIPSAITELAFGLGGSRTHLAILPPLSTYLGNSNAESSELNDGSIGVEVEKEGFRIFFAGDGEVLANERWRGQFATETGGVDVLKAGHHGANDATFDNGFNGSSSWLAHTTPDVVVISANGTTHPRRNALSQLQSAAERTYCTNVHGDIEIRIGEGGVLLITVERNASADCTPGSDATT